jgi:hypothetical protein
MGLNFILSAEVSSLFLFFADPFSSAAPPWFKPVDLSFKVSFS